MTEKYSEEWPEEKRMDWIRKYLANRPCIGCKALQITLRKLFFTKTS